MSIASNNAAPPTADRRTFLDHISALPEPDWSRETRRAALEAAHQLGDGVLVAPARVSESWRKLDLTGLNISDYELQGDGSRLALSGHSAVLQLADFGALKTFPALTQAVRDSTRDRLARNENHVFNLLGVALAQKTLAIRAAGPMREVVYVRHGLYSGNAVMHRVVIDIAPGAELTLVEEFDGRPGEETTLWNCLTDARVGANGRLNYVALRRYADNEFNFHDFHAHLERDARCHVSVLSRGGMRGKSFYNGRLDGPGAEYRAVGLYAGAGREVLDMEMQVEHTADHTHSSILYKTVVRDRCHSIFNGNLNIQPGRKDVDSHQLNQNIVLSPRARAESMPNLVIKAEQVSAEHGAAVGELDREALFYLMSRGVPEDQAREVLIEGFIAEVLQEIPLAEKRDEILLAIKERVLG